MNRRSVWSRLVGGLALSFLLAACAGPASPLAPGSAASFSGADLAVATTEISHDPPPDEVFIDENPCTNEDTEVTFHFLHYVERLTLDGAGGSHLQISGVLEVTTDDGFSGHGQYIVERASVTAGGVEQNTPTKLSVTLGNGTGQRVVVHILAHLVIVDGEVVVDFEIERIECRGKPVA
jgi:hypothetical protein